MTLRRREMENTESVVQLSRSVDTTRAHLQGQLRNKEAENNRLTVQLRVRPAHTGYISLYIVAVQLKTSISIFVDF
uniref:Uncharacterized protein n=1 Tax=Astyanax mexicanus TaxID=7994 RepID=A0A8B9GNQ7_ASTMX